MLPELIVPDDWETNRGKTVDRRDLREDPGFVPATDTRDGLKDDPAVVLTEVVEDNGPDPIVDNGFTEPDTDDGTEVT